MIINVSTYIYTITINDMSLHIPRIIWIQLSPVFWSLNTLVPPPTSRCDRLMAPSLSFDWDEPESDEEKQPYKWGGMKGVRLEWWFIMVHVFAWIITTPAEVSPIRGLVRESSQNALNSGLGIIVICPDSWLWIMSISKNVGAIWSLSLKEFPVNSYLVIT